MFLYFFADLCQRTIAIRRYQHGTEKKYFPEFDAAFLTGCCFAFYLS
jgi:hypothetical protein